MIHELRIYRAAPGKMGALLARFRDHTCKLFEKHGIKNVAYWLHAVGGRNDELWYVLAFEDMGHYEKAWAAFLADPEWQKVQADSEREGGGGLVTHAENRLLRPTDFSPLA